MNIQTVIKRAIKRLELEGKILTPDFYSEAFCLEAKKAGINVEDCSNINKFSKTLNKELQKELTNYRLKTMDEFVRFLIAKLNRTNSSLCSETLEAQSLFTRRILQVVEILHNKEASMLAIKSIDLLNTQPNITQLEQYKQLWANFISNYDDTFLEELKRIGKIDTSDLKNSIENLDISSLSCNSNIDNSILSKLSNILISSLMPSISSKTNKDIDSLSNKIKNNPQYIVNNSFENEIRAAISLRIVLDKRSIKEMFKSLDGVLDKLSFRLIDMIEISDNSTNEIKNIKHELESYTEASSSNFKIAHKKLFTMALALEENTQNLSKELQVHSVEVDSLTQKVKQLESELEAAKEESKEDFLTKLYNKRGIEELLSVKESEYERYKHNYTVVIFDLDHFKNVNDNFGHDAGDAVLAAFSKILKKQARSLDVVGRFGGEEFMVILPETNTQAGIQFAEKVRANVEKARFMYKGKRIDVTVSCGVSERAKNITAKTTIKSSDDALYAAKNAGRNQVISV